MNLTDATGKLAEWQLRLSEPELHVVHRAGIKNRVADASSRLTTTRTDNTPLQDKIAERTVKTITMNDNTDKEDDSDQKATCCNYEELDDEGLQLEVTEGNVFTAKVREQVPRTEGSHS